MMQILDRPPLGPVPRTVATARIVARLDSVAAWALWCCWVPINYGLYVAVTVALFIESLRRVARDPRLTDDRSFVCPWCGSITREYERFPLSCCQMSWQGRHDS